MNLIEPNINDVGRTEDEPSIRDVVDKVSLRYVPELHNVDWVNIIEKSLPYINIYRKDAILHVSGQFAINPVLVLSKLVQDQKKISHTWQSDKDFSLSLTEFANELSRHDQEFDAVKFEIDTSRLEYSLRKAFNNDAQLVQDFLNISDNIVQRHRISTETGTPNSIDHQDQFKRQNEEIELALPFSSNECWQASASHFGALETEESSSTNGTMSSIDFAPSLYQRWYVPFDYLSSNGEVYSSHSGHYHKHSDCSLEIEDDKTKYSTYYSHLELNNISDGTFIEQGQHLGNISLDPDNSNCKCNFAKKSFACATGPHVHLELRYNGEPASLDGKIISNLRIKTGLFQHDMYCSDPTDCTQATYLGEPCATTYTDLTTGKVICPVTKGANIGKTIVLFLFYLCIQ